MMRFNFFLIHFEMVLTCLLYAHHISDEVENTIIAAKKRIKNDFLFGRVKCYYNVWVIRKTFVLGFAFLSIYLYNMSPTT